MVNTNIKTVVDNILNSYETRVKVVCKVMKETALLLKCMSKEQAEMALQLRDTLAKKESLRKRDFDYLLGDIVLRNLDEEKKVNKILENFQKEEEGMIARFRNILTGAEKIKLSEFRVLSKEILEHLDRREKEVSEVLRNFHIEQGVFLAGLRKLVKKGDQIRTRDFKAMTESLRLKQLGKESEIGMLLSEFGKVQEEVKLRWEKVLKDYV